MAVPGEAASGIVTVVTSPGIPSLLLSDDDADGEVDDAHLSVTNEGTMFCRGLTLGMSDAISCDCLAVCSTVSDAIILEGITMGDVEAGLRNSRHSRTLTALFRSRTIPDSSITENKQTLILSVMGDSDDDDVNESRVEPEIQTLFKAVTVGNKAKSFNDLYDLLIVPVTPLTVSKVCLCALNKALLEP